MQVNNKLYQPFVQYAMREQLQSNADTLFDSINLAITSYCMGFDVVQARQLAKVHAHILRMEMIGYGKDNPRAKVFKKYKFVKNTEVMFNFIVTETMTNSQDVFQLISNYKERVDEGEKL